MFRRVMLALVFAMPLPAAANDSIAGLGAGGIVLGRTDGIEMQREDLAISMEEVGVDYVFRNILDKDIETIVAFPMPDIAANPYGMAMLPDDASDNFLDFSVIFDGREIRPELEQRGVAVGIDVTDELAEHGVSPNPYLDTTFAQLKQVPQPGVDDWIKRGLLMIDSYDDGSGWKDVRTPMWTLKSTYWWRATFPAGRPVKVSHRYRPSVASAVAVSFYDEGGFRPPYEDYKARYCFDAAFEKAVRRAGAANGGSYPQYSENRVQYVLTSGGNWARGTIGRFHLTVDKGDPRNLVSFCGTGVRKTGPTTFELTATDYFPEKDIEILILKPWDESSRGAISEPVEGGTAAAPKTPATVQP